MKLPDMFQKLVSRLGRQMSLNEKVSSAVTGVIRVGAALFSCKFLFN